MTSALEHERNAYYEGKRNEKQRMSGVVNDRIDEIAASIKSGLIQPQIGRLLIQELRYILKQVDSEVF